MISRAKRYLKRQMRQTRRKIIKTRPITHVIKKQFPHDTPITGCEVGVFKADNAQNMLDNIPNLKTLFLVDPYVEYEGYVPFGPLVDSDVDEDRRERRRWVEWAKAYAKNMM